MRRSWDNWDSNDIFFLLLVCKGFFFSFKTNTIKYEIKYKITNLKYKCFFALKIHFPFWWHFLDYHLQKDWKADLTPRMDWMALWFLVGPVRIRQLYLGPVDSGNAWMHNFLENWFTTILKSLWMYNKCQGYYYIHWPSNVSPFTPLPSLLVGFENLCGRRLAYKFGFLGALAPSLFKS